MSEQQPSSIFWDWDGVLGLQKFWNKSTLGDKSLCAFTNFLFADPERTREWMRGKLTIGGLAMEYGTDFTSAKLGQLLAQDWSERAINEDLFTSVREANPKAQHYIVTDNMDVFNDFAQDHIFVRRNFRRVFNSSDYGVLKDDEPGLYEVVLRELGMQSFAGCLVLDDSTANCNRFKQLGDQSVLVV